MSQGAEGELVFAVSISSFTKRGYVGSASYQGSPVDIEFDDRDEGVFLTAEMCKRLHVKEGSRLLLVVEADGEPLVAEASASRPVSKPRISNARVYYSVGREGGAVVTLKKAH